MTRVLYIIYNEVYINRDKTLDRVDIVLINSIDDKHRRTFMMQTDSITSLTPEGGLVIAFTIDISFCLRVSRAAIAAFRAGIATANCSSHSSCKYIIIICYGVMGVSNHKRKELMFYFHKTFKI